MALVLKKDSEFYNKLIRIEQLCNELGVRIISFCHTFVEDVKTGKTFRVGEYENQDSFPRDVDCEFYVVGDDDIELDRIEWKSNG